MITLQEYVEAVEIIEKYHQQVKNKIEAGKTPVKEWDKLDQCSKRLYNVLIHFKFIEDISEKIFMRTRNAGRKSWVEFEDLRGY